MSHALAESQSAAAAVDSSNLLYIITRLWHALFVLLVYPALTGTGSFPGV